MNQNKSHKGYVSNSLYLGKHALNKELSKHYTFGLMGLTKLFFNTETILVVSMLLWIKSSTELYMKILKIRKHIKYVRDNTNFMLEMNSLVPLSFPPISIHPLRSPISGEDITIYLVTNQETLEAFLPPPFPTPTVSYRSPVPIHFPSSISQWFIELLKAYDISTLCQLLGI